MDYFLRLKWSHAQCQLIDENAHVETSILSTASKLVLLISCYYTLVTYSAVLHPRQSASLADAKCFAGTNTSKTLRSEQPKNCCAIDGRLQCIPENKGSITSKTMKSSNFQVLCSVPQVLNQVAITNFGLMQIRNSLQHYQGKGQIISCTDLYKYLRYLHDLYCRLLGFECKTRRHQVDNCVLLPCPWLGCCEA